jgi:rod shape-determining protein MreC
VRSWSGPALGLAVAVLLYVGLGAAGWHDRLRSARGAVYRITRTGAGAAPSAAEMQGQLAALQAENQRLRRLLDLPRKGWKLSLTANCLHRDGEQAYGDLWLDRGRRDGVGLRTVALHGSGLVGRVVEVRPETCRLRPILHPSARVPVALGEAAFQGVAHGAAWSLHVEQVRPRPPLPAGALVITSGLGQVYPAGVLVGTVRKSLASSDPLFARYEVEPSVLLDQVLEVLLVEVGS